ncbi:hypothetical protein Hanom_Chr07g00670141 [Helianthus anomalus]
MQLTQLPSSLPQSCTSNSFLNLSTLSSLLPAPLLNHTLVDKPFFLSSLTTPNNSRLPFAPVLHPFFLPGQLCSNSFAAFLKPDSIGPNTCFTSSTELKNGSNGSLPFTVTITVL